MLIAISLFFFVLGTIIGSFLNVVILRYNTGMGINGRSGCFSCSKNLEWYELIPVLSFIVQRGKCRKCKASLSWQYPVVELLTGLVFFAIFIKYSVLFYRAFPSFVFLTLYSCIIWALLIVITVYDLRHKIIPNGLVYTFSFVALLKLVADLFADTLNGSMFLAGPILFLPFFALWYVSKGKWIGLGDGKLAVGMGWMLGLGYGISAVVLGFWIGAVVGLSILLVNKFPSIHKLITKLISESKQLTMKSEIPFAPFLIIGLALVFFFSIDVVGIVRIFGI